MRRAPALVLQMRNIAVRYGETLALRGVDFDLYPGEIHALVGEHRAGKSTLVKLLSGAVRKERGEILLDGQRVETFTPASSMRHRIGMLYQEMNVVPSLNAVENIYAGRTPVRALGRPDKRLMIGTARRIFQDLKVGINLEAPLFKLTMAERLMVELARVLSLDPRIIIFDEVSSKLTPVEMEVVYPLLFKAKQERRSVIYISHNMDEIFQFADRVTVLKDGRSLGTEEIKGLDKMKLIRMTYSFVLSRKELEQDNKELLSLKRYNESIVRNLPVGVVILDPRHKLYMLNTPAADLLGVPRESLINRPLESLPRMRGIGEQEEILRCIRAQREGRWEEVRIGDGRVVKLSVFPFKDDDYRFLGTIVLMEDVTRDLQFKDYLLRTGRVASVAELAAGIAHEINNPLGIILNHTALLKRTAAVDGPGLARVRVIESELQRIKEIIASLLSFSRVDELPMTAVDLEEVVADVVRLVRHRIAQKRIRFTRRRATGGAVVRGNANKLKQVFINLILNGVEAVKPGGSLAVGVRVRRQHGSVEVRVTDDGCGIPEEIRGRIFDPFFTTKKGEKNTGLGLSISQHIVETHEGVLDFTSGGGKTEFVVHLPLMVARRESGFPRAEARRA
jgi:two-component system, NtrC family, sensor histidine kinase AtoS